MILIFSIRIWIRSSSDAGWKAWVSSNTEGSLLGLNRR